MVGSYLDLSSNLETKKKEENMNIKEFFRCDNDIVVIFKGSYVF